MSKRKIEWSLTTYNLKDLEANGYNPRKISDNEKRDLLKSIKEFGTVVPLVVNIGARQNIIIGGEQRARIYVEMGIEKIECIVPSRELTLEEEKELNLRLNKNTGSWDEELLKEFEIDTLLDVGFGDEELQDFFDDIDLTEDQYDFEEALHNPPESIVRNGEIWKLGRHRLLVGDSTDIEKVKKLMEEDEADIIYCDMPYNIGLSYATGMGKSKKYNGSYSRKDDSKEDKDYVDFMNQSIEVAKSIAKYDAHYFYWCDPSKIWMVQNLYAKNQIDAERICMWIKNNQNPTHKIAFNRVYEPCVYGITGKPYLNTNLNNVNEVLNQEVTTGNQVHDDILDMIDIWIDKRDNTQEYLHPTQKPISLNEKPLRRCSAPGHIVFSGFAGSGSDLIACEVLQRKWRGVEKDLIFATIIIDRWEKFTGLKAQKIYGNK